MHSSCCKPEKRLLLETSYAKILKLLIDVLNDKPILPLIVLCHSARVA